MDFSANTLEGIICWLDRVPQVPVIFAETDLAGHLQTPPRSLLEWVWVREGAFELRVGSLKARVQAGDVVWLNAHQGNGAELRRNPARYACVSLDVAEFPGRTAWKTRPWLQVLRPGPDLDLRAAYGAVARLHRSPSEALREPLLRAACVHLLGGLEAVGAVRGASTWPPALRRALACIDAEHARADLSLTAVATTAHCSPSTLRRLFAEHLGISPVAHLNTLRLQRAHDLLARTGQSVKEVATAVGYTDPLYFSRAFRRHHGFSPSRLRHG